MSQRSAGARLNTNNTQGPNFLKKTYLKNTGHTNISVWYIINKTLYVLYNNK